jgi:hypothetical protein
LQVNETIIDKTTDRLVDESFMSGEGAPGDQIPDFKAPGTAERKRKGFDFDLETDRSNSARVDNHLQQDHQTVRLNSKQSLQF